MSTPRSPRRFGALRLALAFLGSLLPSATIAQQPRILAPHRPVAPRLPRHREWDPPAVSQSLTGGFWMTDSSTKAILNLSNMLKTDPLTVTPVLHLGNGSAYSLPAVTLEPSGTAAIKINDALASQGIAPYATLYGYVEVRYKWGWQAICGSVWNVDTQHSLIFVYSMRPAPSDAPPPSSSPQATVLEGLWWKQEDNVGAFVALLNVTAKPMTATVEVLDASNREIARHEAAISPHGTKIVELDELKYAATSTGGLLVSFPGREGELLVNASLKDATVGYSARLPLGLRPDPSAKTSPDSYSELGLMTGPPDPMMSFPAGVVFAPYSVVRNTSEQPLSVSPTLWWMEAGSPRSARLPVLTLAPHQTQQMDIRASLAAVGLKNFNGSFNLVLDAQEQRGALLLASGSVDQSNTYVFEVVPRGVGESASKGLQYWSTANGDDTMVTLWNPADEPQDFVFTLFYAGGHYAYPIHLEARATQSFNILTIVDRQIPDADGNVVPGGIHEGSAEIAGSLGENQSILVAIDSPVYNVRKATCGIFYCTTCSGVVPSSVFVSDNPFAVPVSGTHQESFHYSYNSGTQYDATNTSNWSSSNAGIATVSSGLTSGVAPGSVTITAQDVNSEPEFSTPCQWNTPPYCNPVYIQPSSSGGGTVTPTVSIGGNLGYIYIGQDPTVPQLNALYGQGNPPGGTYKWSTPDTSTSFENAAAQDVHVTATNYTGQTNDTKIALDYMQSGQSAQQASVMVTKRIFKFLGNDSVIQLNAYNGPTQYGYLFTATYNVFANPGGKQVTTGSGVSDHESVTQKSSNVPVTPQTGGEPLNANSQVVDTLKLTSNAPLPSSLSIVDSQDWAVGGIYVRTNTVTWSATSVSVTSQGPFN